MANVSSSNGLEKCPKLRFPEFDGQYCEATLSDVFDYERPDKYIVTSEKYSADYSVPVLTANQAFVLGYTNETEGIYSKGAVILFDDFTCDMKFADFPFKVKSSAMKLLTPKNEVPIYYAYGLLQHVNYKPVGHARHWISIMQPITVMLPTTSEQKKISNLLILLDARIEKQQQMVATLKKYKRGVIKQLLSPESSTLANVTWTTTKIGKIGTFIKGAPLSKADISEDGTPFILYGELYTTYNEVATDIVRKTKAEVDSVYLSQLGDVVIPTSGETPEEISTATCVMVPDVILAGDLNIFRTDALDGRILSYILNHIVNGEIARVAQGKSVVHIQASEIAKIEIAYPDSKAQKKLITLFDALSSKIANEDGVLQQLKEVKRSLLQQLFI